MTRTGLTSLIWYLSWLAVWTCVARALMHFAGKKLVQHVPDASSVVCEVEHYGWWIAAVLGAIIAMGLS